MRTLDPQSLTQHVDRLYRAAWALCGSREDAEDLVQETFARVLARPRVLNGDDELYYLMRVLRNTFLTSRRTAEPAAGHRGHARGRRRGRSPAARPARAGAGDAGGVRDDRGAAGGPSPRAGGRRRARPLLPGSRPRAARARGDDHDQAVPGTQAGRARVGARAGFTRLRGRPGGPRPQPHTPAIRREETRAAGVLPGRGTP